MLQNKNEVYLLKYLSGVNQDEKDNKLINFLVSNNIKINFSNTNPIYQIIDEMYFSNILNIKDN